MAEQSSNYNFLTKDIIGNRPRWIVRWGITVIFLILFSLAITLSLIKYPVSTSFPANIEYDRKPIPIIAAENSILTEANDIATPGAIQKGTNIMVLETVANRTKNMVNAPVSGSIYMLDRYRINSFIKQNQVLAFVLPQPNEHIVKFTVTADKCKNLKTGQPVLISINGYSHTNSNLEGKIDYISPGFLNGTYNVTVKFPSTVNEQLSADPLLATVDSIKCTAGFTIDTMSYLKYIFRKKNR